MPQPIAKEIESALVPDTGVTRIGPEIAVRGDVACRDNLILEGSLEGNVQGEALVYVGRAGKVVGDIKAHSVIVDGEVEGNIEAGDRIELRPSCRVQGDIRTVRAKISEGSLLMGNLTVLGREDAPGRAGG